MHLKKLTSAAFVLLIIVLFSIFLSSCGPISELKVISGSGGTINANPAGLSYYENALVRLSAVPDSGYYFTGWGNIDRYSNDSASSSEISIIMPAEPIEITAGFAQKGKGWTFLVYLAGDNSLSPNAPVDINEMEQGIYDALEAGNTSISGDLKVLVLADFSGTSDTTLYLIGPDNGGDIVSAKLTGGSFPAESELNMGHPDTLRDFIKFGLTSYPSQYNALVLWNHGGGAKSLDTDSVQSRDICQDLTSGDILYNDEVQQGIRSGLTAANISRFDIIGMDACLMGTVETAYELKELGTYFTASPAEEWVNGWDYRRLFRNFGTEGFVPEPPVMADMIVTQYKESTDTESTGNPNTMTAIDLSKMGNLKTEIDKLAAALSSNYSAAGFETLRDAETTGRFYTNNAGTAPYTDLYSFCSGVTGAASAQATAVLGALNAAVVSSYARTSNIQLSDYYETADSEAARGLSVFISHGEKGDYSDHWWYTNNEVTASYQGSDATFLMGSLDFCTINVNGKVDTWKELFELWYGSGSY